MESLNARFPGIDGLVRRLDEIPRVLAGRPDPFGLQVDQRAHRFTLDRGASQKDKNQKERQ